MNGVRACVRKRRKAVGTSVRRKAVEMANSEYNFGSGSVAQLQLGQRDLRDLRGPTLLLIWQYADRLPELESGQNVKSYSSRRSYNGTAR